jgi:hypothetical protein
MFACEPKRYAVSLDAPGPAFEIVGHFHFRSMPHRVARLVRYPRRIPARIPTRERNAHWLPLAFASVDPPQNN